MFVLEGLKEFDFWLVFTLFDTSFIALASSSAVRLIEIDFFRLSIW